MSPVREKRWRRARRRGRERGCWAYIRPELLEGIGRDPLEPVYYRMSVDPRRGRIAIVIDREPHEETAARSAAVTGASVMLEPVPLSLLDAAEPASDVEVPRGLVSILVPTGDTTHFHGLPVQAVSATSRGALVRVTAEALDAHRSNAPTADAQS